MGRSLDDDECDANVDSGQAVGLILMSVALVATIALAIAEVSVRMTDRSRAQNAADAAALAGVVGGVALAGEAAARNGGHLVSFDDVVGDEGVTVTVQVVVGDERAVARASDEP